MRLRQPSILLLALSIFSLSALAAPKQNVMSVQGRPPKFLPDVPAVRADSTDSRGESQARDAGVGVLDQQPEAIGELDQPLPQRPRAVGPGAPRGNTRSSSALR